MIRFRVGRMFLIATLVFTAGIVTFGVMHRVKPEPFSNVAHAASDERVETPVKANVVRPTQGGLDRTCVVPGSIHAFESAELFAKVTGYLDKLNVDIGDRVTAGQILAEIYAPELQSDVDRRKADVEKALAQVKQMEAGIVVAQANFYAVKTGISRAKAVVKRDKSAYEFRDKQYLRFKELVQSKSIDERLVDEKMEQRIAAGAAVDAAEAGVAETEAQAASAEAQIEKANADLIDAKAEVDVTKANLERAEVFANYTKITAPYDGVITLRTYHRGDFIRGADQSSVEPMLKVERMDVVRLVVHVPDSYVPWTNVGADSVTTIETLPGHNFPGKVSRMAVSEDQKTKTMRTEVDLQNDRGLLRNGMFGRTKLILHAANPDALTIPSTALVGSTKDDKGTVFVVRDGIARKIPVIVSVDNGVSVEIKGGITSDEMVIVGNNNSITDGLRVEAHEAPPTDADKKSSTGH